MFVGIGMNLVRGGASSSPASLFAAAEPGAWYDPSDLSTLFQDNLGATPVTAPAQTVGLMLDKSQGLVRGPELVTNGDFSGGVTGWTAGNGASLSVVSGNLRVSYSTGAAFPNANQTISGLVSGRAYEITVVANTGSGTHTVGLNCSQFSPTINTTIAIGTTTSTYKTIVTATGTTSALQVFANTGSATSSGFITLVSFSVKLLAGNHATQATSTQRPIYGINPIVGTRNRLTYTEEFENSYWTKTNATVTANNTASPSGTMTADKLVEDTTVISTHNLLRNYIIASFSGTVTLSIYAKADTRSLITLYMDNSAGVSVAYEFNLSTLTSANTNANVAWSAHSAQIVDAGNGWRRCSITATRATTDALSTRICLGKAGSTYTVGIPVYTGDGASGLFIWGAQLEQSATATAYQKVVTQYEVTEAGVQSASYLAFDGVDDGMVTGTITPATDKAQVFAGVRKLSDAARGMLAETGNTAAGSIYIEAPSLALNDYNFRSAGSANANAGATPYAAPTTNVLTALGDISAPFAIMRVNGVQKSNTITTQGTGNYLAYPLYIGRRGGTTLPFNGRIYSLIVRFGANLTTGQITATESWVNGETGAY